MLNKKRYDAILDRLNEIHVEQMLVCDPLAVYYLLDRWIYPGERFLGLLIRKDAEPVLFINRLFAFNEELGTRNIWFTDTDDIIPLLKEHIDKEKMLGVDKILESRFLLPMMENEVAERFINTSLAVDTARAIKDEEEKEKMRKASFINDQAMERFKKLVHENVTELEIADQTLKIYKELGASGYSFEPIVSFGRNAADPHHMPDETVLEEGDCVLLDIGCVAEDYCSDMTRTFYFKRQPDERVRQIYELVRKANESAEAMVKEGVTISDIDKTARDIITQAGYGPQFNHRLGHFIGLQDHEFGDVSSANSNKAVAGNIFSIEPGIYLMGDTGVRIEDLVIVTEDGCEVLNHYPKEIEVIR